MLNYISDSNDNELSGFLSKAKDNASIRTIETQMLDGSFTIQTIGSSVSKVSVEFYCCTATRRELQACISTCQPIKVYWLDRVWTGLISGGKLDWERFSRYETKIQEKLAFEVLVTEEAAR